MRAGTYQVCGRCARRLMPDMEYPARQAEVKGGVIAICFECNRVEVYNAIGDFARNMVIAVLLEGEEKYPDVSLPAIRDKRDHMDHADGHWKGLRANDEAEDHLAHLVARLVLERMRQRHAQ